MSGGTADDYVFAYQPATLLVGETAQSITFFANLDATYGDGPVELNATAGSGLPVSYASSDSSVVEVNGTQLIFRGAGAAVVTASQGGSANYDPAADATATVQVAPALLTVVAQGASKAYLAEVPQLTYDLVGFVHGEEASALSELPSIATTATASSPAGSYPVTVSGGTADDYVFAYQPATLLVGEDTQVIVITQPDDDTKDVDGDGLSKGEEEAIGTSDLLQDSDGDGFSDAAEVAAGSDPTRADSLPNRAPTKIFLSFAMILENQPVGTLVGVFSTEDPDHNDSHAYSFADGPGSEDNFIFRIEGDALYALGFFDFESKEVYQARVRSTDAKGLSMEQSFSVDVLDAFRPGVETLDPTQVETTSARLSGRLLDDGGLDILQQGFVVGRQPDPEVEQNDVESFPGVSGEQPGVFFHKLTNLRPQATYYARAYARNAEGVTYGEQVKFTTETTFDSGPLANAAEIPGKQNWRESHWFGSFYQTHRNWIYHAELGWLYVSGNDSSNIWLWSPRLQWLWTSQGIYPYLYRHLENDWYLFLQDFPNRTILFRYATREWVDY